MEKVLLKGNEALAEAAVAAGCRFYSGYPITPQTEILEYLSWRMEEAGGVFIQAESELSGINMVLGAAAAGARALTSSSGPGFSLKQEGISYLVAADLPAVIVDVMRIGTGLGDISQGQGDYWQLTRGGGHGDYRTIVLAPASVQENADLMAEAFDLAEKYRHPVLIASDAAIGQMIEAVEIPKWQEHNIDKFEWTVKGCKKGEEHKKIQNVYYTRVCMETVELARERGWKAGLIRPVTLWPFPSEAFQKASKAKRFLSVEMNILGQMADDIRLAVGGKIPVEHYGSIFEIPEPEGLLEKIKDWLNKEGD